MIFVAVGTQKFQLNRLLKQLDLILENGQLCEDVFAQKGNSDYIPKHYAYKDFLSKEEFDRIVDKCDILITHSGVGTIISGMKFQKPIIIFPRLAKYHEHVDDHQLQIAKAFSEQNFVLLCQTEDQLYDAILKARKTSFQVYQSNRENVINEIRSFLSDK